MLTSIRQAVTIFGHSTIQISQRQYPQSFIRALGSFYPERSIALTQTYG
jgi:hypothetical protein